MHHGTIQHLQNASLSDALLPVINLRSEQKVFLTREPF